MKAAVLLLCAMLLHSTVGHICMIFPAQRGGFNITGPGNHACYQSTGPCGTKPAEAPQMTLRGGQSFNLFFQQNLNHYTPGNPGFLEVAIGSTGATEDSQFLPLAVIPDYWPHYQASQTNFSIPFLVPDINCDHCILQLRYHPNKPTEPIFHQCADISIRRSVMPALKGSLVAIAKVGDPFAATNKYSTFVDVDFKTGGLTPLYDHFRVAQRSTSTVPALFESPTVVAGNGLLAADTLGDLLFFGQEFSAVSDNVPLNTLFFLNLASGSLEGRPAPPPHATVTEWVALLSTEGVAGAVAPQVAVGLYQNSTTGVYRFNVNWLFGNGISSQIGGPSPSDSTFVNVFWSVVSCGKVYVLVGDENNLFGLDVKLLTFSLENGYESSVMVDNSAYTISSLFAEQDCTLRAVTPGLVEISESDRVYSLVTINPTTGSVTNAVALSQAGEFDLYYAGGVYGNGQALVNEGMFFQMFRRAVDNVFELRAYDLTGKVISATTLDVGTNSQAFISSLTYVA